MKLQWFLKWFLQCFLQCFRAPGGIGALIFFVGTAFSAPVPVSKTPSIITDDRALYEELQEVNIPKEATPGFDRELKSLSNQEKNYLERLPLSKRRRLEGAINRVLKMKYRPTALPSVPLTAGS